MSAQNEAERVAMLKQQEEEQLLRQQEVQIAQAELAAKELEFK